MAKNLAHQIEVYLDRKVDFEKEVKLVDDGLGEGAYIAYWSDSIEKAKPTEEQLATYNVEADKRANNANVIATRKELYGGWEKQIENIIENGLEAEQARVNQIKTDNPK